MWCWGMELDSIDTARVLMLLAQHQRAMAGAQAMSSGHVPYVACARDAEVELAPYAPGAVRFGNRFGCYLAASSQPFLLGMTAPKVLQAASAEADASGLDVPSLDWILLNVQVMQRWTEKTCCLEQGLDLALEVGMLDMLLPDLGRGGYHPGGLEIALRAWNSWPWRRPGDGDPDGILGAPGGGILQLGWGGGAQIGGGQGGGLEDAQRPGGGGGRCPAAGGGGGRRPVARGRRWKTPSDGRISN